MIDVGIGLFRGVTSCLRLLLARTHVNSLSQSNLNGKSPSVTSLLWGNRSLTCCLPMHSNGYKARVRKCFPYAAICPLYRQAAGTDISPSVNGITPCVPRLAMPVSVRAMLVNPTR